MTMGMSGADRFHLANISSRDPLFMVFLSQLPSLQPPNSKKSQFIVFVNAIFSDRPPLAKSSLFDRVSIRRSTDNTFLNVFSSTYPSKSSTVVIHFEISVPPQALSNVSRIAQGELFHSIPIRCLTENDRNI
jgi:hypothetical protein